MRAPQPTTICTACGQANPDTASTCASCGTPCNTPSVMGDPLANSVSGAPVTPGPYDWRTDLGSARERLTERVPEMAATLAEAVSRRFGVPPAPPAPPPRRYMLRRTVTRMPVPPPGRLTFRRPGAGLPAPVPIPPVPVPARVLWFVFAGSWLTCLWVIATWLVLCTVIGRPLAARMIDLLPSVLTLRPATAVMQPTAFSPMSTPDYDPAARAIYFLLVGWWVSLVWMLAAYAIALTGIGIPIGYRMFARTPAIAHLQRP